MKKIIYCILLLSLIFGNPIPVNASEDTESKNEYEIVYDENESYIIDSQGTIHNNFYTASGEKLSIEESLLILQGYDNSIYNNNNNNNRALILPDDIEPGTFVLNSYNLTFPGTEQKVTADVLGPATISYGESITITETFSFDASVTIKEIMIKNIEAEVGFTWSSSADSTKTFSVSFPVSDGKIGAVYFTPYYGKFDAAYVHSEQRIYKGTLMSPKKTASGFADGLYQLKETD